MAFSRDTYPTTKRVGVVYGVLLRIVPGDFRLQVEVQRAPDSSGSPDTANAVSVQYAGPFGRSGGLWADRRPNDGSTWHYRIRHVSKNKSPGDWSSWLSAVPYRLEPEELAAAATGADIYPIDRSIAMTDGNYTVPATTSSGLRVINTATDNADRLLNAHFSKTSDDLDDALDGATYGKPKLTALTSGEVDLSKAGVIEKYANRIARSSSNATVLSTIAQHLADTGHAASTLQDSRATAINTHFGKTVDDLDDAVDGATYGKPKLTALTTGEVDLSKAGVINKNYDNLSDGSTYGGLRKTARTQAFQRVPAHGSNLLFNYSFEDGGDFWDSVGSIDTSSANARSGNKYAERTVSSDTDWLRAADMDGNLKYFEVAEDDVLTFGGWFKRTAGTGSVAIRATAYDKDKVFVAHITGNGITSSSYSLSNDRYVVPSGVKYVILLARITASSSSTFRADDFYLNVNRSGEDVYGALNADLYQSDGVDVRIIAKGHLGGSARNGDTISFPISFQNTPMVLLSGGIKHEPRSKWGSTGSGSESGAYDTGAATYEDLAPLNLTASQFTLRARLKQKGSSTDRSVNAAVADNVLDAEGETATADLGTVGLPAADDTYVVHYKVDLDAAYNRPSDSTTTVTVAIESNDGSGWVTRATRTYQVTADESNPSASSLWSHEAVPILVSGLGNNDDIRISIASLTLSKIGGACAVHLFADTAATPDDPENGVTWYSSGGDQFASMTPSVSDNVRWEAMAVS